MSGKIKILVLLSLIGLLALPTLVRTQNPGTSVFLKASFRDANDVFGYPLDKLRSDGKGFYQNAKDLTVMFNSEGELEFDIGKRSGRRVNFIFNDYLRYGSCTEKPPDTTGADPFLPDEPINYGHFHTHMESYMAGPKVNFLEMQPEEIKEVRFWIVFTTAVRSYFYLTYDQDFLDNSSGFVMVHAIDTNGDSIVDRWILYPKPYTNDRANLHRKSLTGKNRQICDLGDFRMPFELTLDRVN